MKNKPKRWRRIATLTKQGAVRAGEHIKGRRYGRAIKWVFESQGKIKAFPSNLFLAMAGHAGILKVKEI